MATSTVYDVRLRYLLEDRATGGLGRMERQLDKTSKSAGLLSAGLGKLAGVVGVGMLANAGRKAFISFNSDMEQMVTTMAGMIQLSSDTGWTDSFKMAGDMVGKLQEKAKASVGTTQEFVKMAQMLTQPILSAGGAMADLENLTAASVVGSKALGIEAETAARDVGQALRGVFNSQDQFTGAILGSKGFQGEEGRKRFNEMEGAARMRVLSEALSQDALSNLAKAQEQTFDGIFSTLQDNLQMTFGKAGLPLFKAIGEEIQRWNTWIDGNQDTVQRLVTELGTGLSEVFGVVKDAVGFMVDNAGTLTTLAKVWATVRAGKAIGGLLGGGLASGGNLLQRMGGGLLSKGFDTMGIKAASAGASLASLGSTIASRLLPGIGLAVVAFEGIYAWWKKSRQDEETARKRMALDTATKQMLDVQQRRESALRAKGELTGALSKAQIEQLTGSAVSDAIGPLERAKLQGFTRPGERAGTMEGAAPLRAGELDRLSPFGRVRVELAQKVLEETDRDLIDAQRALLKFAVDEKLISENRGRWSIDAVRFQKEIRDRMELTSDEWSRVASQIFSMERELQRGTIDIRDLFGLKYGQGDEDDMLIPRAMPDSMTSKPKVNVTIQRIEVQSDDPDRFVFGMVSAFQDAAKNPSSAMDTFREG
jgi:hypothetical protein